MRKYYYSNFSYGSNDILKWKIYRNSINELLDGNDEIYKNNLVVKGFRECINNEERFKFINNLIDAERELLVLSINDNEFNCFINILKGIESLSLNHITHSRIEKREFEVELLINNVMQKVKFVKEVRCYV